MRTCSIERGSWIQRGLNSISMSASSSGEYTVLIVSGSCGANSSVIISRVYAAKAAISGTLRVDEDVAAEQAAAPLVVVEGRVDVNVDHAPSVMLPPTNDAPPRPTVAQSPSVAATGMVPAGAGRSGRRT